MWIRPQLIIWFYYFFVYVAGIMFPENSFPELGVSIDTTFLSLRGKGTLYPHPTLPKLTLLFVCDFSKFVCIFFLGLNDKKL